MIESVYIAGPMTTGWLLDHIKEAVKAADKLMLAGFVPFVPQMCCFWSLMLPTDYGYEGWLDWDFYWVGKCDALLRLDGISNGGDREVAEAKKHNIPVFFGQEGLEALLELKNAST